VTEPSGTIGFIIIVILYAVIGLLAAADRLSSLRSSSPADQSRSSTESFLPRSPAFIWLSWFSLGTSRRGGPSCLRSLGSLFSAYSAHDTLPS